MTLFQINKAATPVRAFCPVGVGVLPASQGLLGLETACRHSGLCTAIAGARGAWGAADAVTGSWRLVEHIGALDLHSPAGFEQKGQQGAVHKVV